MPLPETVDQQHLQCEPSERERIVVYVGLPKADVQNWAAAIVITRGFQTQKGVLIVSRPQEVILIPNTSIHLNLSPNFK